jgi:uncharacterized protein (UPF0332 family)
MRKKEECATNSLTRFLIMFHLSKALRRRTKGYNEKEHNSLIQINRSKWLENLSFGIEVGWINSYEELKETFQKLKVIEKE